MNEADMNDMAANDMASIRMIWLHIIVSRWLCFTPPSTARCFQEGVSAAAAPRRRRRGTASRRSMINRMRKSSYGSGATSKPAKPASTAFYEELFNRFKDSEDSDSIGTWQMPLANPDPDPDHRL